MTRSSPANAHPIDAPVARDDVSCWRHVEARVTYLDGQGSGPQRLALLHTIDQGPEFRELIFMLEAWLSSTQAQILDIAFAASAPVFQPAPCRLEN